MSARGQQESQKARAAWLDYLAMGPERTILGLYKIYQERITEGKDVPARNIKSLFVWSSRWSWQARIHEIERSDEENIRDQLSLARKEVLERGLSLDFERVRALEKIAVKAESALEGMDFTTASARRLEVLTGTLFQALTDIAKETGGRATKVDIRHYLLDYAQQRAAELGISKDEALQLAERAAKRIK